MSEQVKDTVKVEKKPKTRKFEVSFRQNRKFELYVGRLFFVFMPNEIKVLDEEVIEHPHFKQQESYFTIREVK